MTLSRDQCVQFSVNLSGLLLHDLTTSVSLLAAGDSCTEGTLRVVSGKSREEGRVELCHNHLWGAIVDREWNLSKAAVVCRERGFEPAGECVHTIA